MGHCSIIFVYPCVWENVVKSIQCKKYIEVRYDIQILIMERYVYSKSQIWNGFMKTWMQLPHLGNRSGKLAERPKQIYPKDYAYSRFVKMFKMSQIWLSNAPFHKDIDTIFDK